MPEDDTVEYTSKASDADNGEDDDDANSPLGLETTTGGGDDNGDNSSSSSDDSNSGSLVYSQRRTCKQNKIKKVKKWTDHSNIRKENSGVPMPCWCLPDDLLWLMNMHLFCLLSAFMYVPKPSQYLPMVSNASRRHLISRRASRIDTMAPVSLRASDAN